MNLPDPTDIDRGLTDAIRELEPVYGARGIVVAVESMYPGAIPPQPVPSFPARATDPGTSDASAQRKQTADVGRFSTRSQCAKLLRAIAERPTTAYGAAYKVNASMQPSRISVPRFEGARRRVSDLVRAGYVADSGQRRRNPGSPDKSIVWEITPQGRQALVRLEADGWSK